MPSKRFKAAMAKLSKSDAAVIHSQLAKWKAEAAPSPWPQVAANIERETALAPAKFTRLLRDFAHNLPDHTDSANAWRKTCETHTFGGKQLSNADRPRKLGRAGKFDMFLKFAKTSDTRFKETLTKWAGRIPPTFLKNELAKQKLGGNVIFATFNDNDPSGDPFGDLPRDRVSIRTALGLGMPDHTTTDPYLLFTYVSDEPPDLPLHRPTISDAGDFSYYTAARHVL